MDPYTLLKGHEFDLFGHHCELHGSRGKAKGKGFELIGPTLEMKTHVLPRLTVNGYMEVCIFEIYGCDPLPYLEGGSYGLWGLHLERPCV